VSSCESGGSCSGGYFSALDYVKSKGLPNEADDPYQARNSRCKNQLTSKAKLASWAYVGQRGREPTIDEIKAAIYHYGPVVVDVNASFGAYKGGVYDRCNTNRTDHMVTIEGWDEAGKYWIVRNSWGSDWGEDGYFRIKWTDARGRKCNGIGRVAAFAVID
jgi:C1A family cysteine protease